MAPPTLMSKAARACSRSEPLLPLGRRVSARSVITTESNSPATPEAGDTESAYGRHVQDMQLLSSLSNIERNRLLNLMIRKNTLRTTALVFIHQDWHPRLLSTSDSADEGRQDSAETPTRWIEELRVLTDELPPTLMTSPNSSAVTSDV